MRQLPTVPLSRPPSSPETYLRRHKISSSSMSLPCHSVSRQLMVSWLPPSSTTPLFPPRGLRPSQHTWITSSLASHRHLVVFLRSSSPSTLMPMVSSTSLLPIKLASRIALPLRTTRVVYRKMRLSVCSGRLSNTKVCKSFASPLKVVY